MNIKTALKRDFIKRTVALDSLLKKPVKKFTVENFHQLRVEIKKINALLKLLNFCAKDFKRKKHFKTIKSVFKQAGKVRELQLEEAALKNYAVYQGLKSYMKNLKRMRKKEKKVFFSMVNNKLTSELKKYNKAVLPFILKVNEKDTISFLNKKRSKIEMLFNEKDLKLEQVHELRKLIKEYYHDWKSLNLPEPGELLKLADAFQDLLGKWHDSIIIKDHLNEAINDIKKMKPEETGQLKRIKKWLTADCDLMLKKINTAIHVKGALQNLFRGHYENFSVWNGSE